MFIEDIEIKNFKGLQYVEFKPKLSTCLIGHNNSGKSSILQAIHVATEAKSFSKDSCYDSEFPIEITFTLRGCTEDQLLRINPQHAEKFRPILTDESIRLKYSWHPSNGNSYTYQALVPKHEGLRDLETSIKGKKTIAEKQAVIDSLGDYAGAFMDVKTQKVIIETADELIASLPEDELIASFKDLPSGIPSSITRLLPEIVYVPAVKDLSEETKATESASFGKLLKITLEEIRASAEFEEFEKSFEKLGKLLNRIPGDDSRLPQIASIEESLEGYIQDYFGRAKVELKIPSPDLKQVLKNASIVVDDGVATPIEAKGDGIKRAMLFALIRTYVDIKRRNEESKLENDVEGKVLPRPICFLFEEPELFLHPDAQGKLFKAICSLTELGHQVIITTHSPHFVKVGATTTFVKLHKPYSDGKYDNPTLFHYDLLTDLPKRDAFQILCFENTAAAFFSDRVLLVEGDSDQLYVPEIAKALNPEWDFEAQSIPIVQVGGKHGVKRYRKFFESIGVKVFALVDGDCMSDGYGQLGLSDEANQLCKEQSDLLNAYKPTEPIQLSGKQAQNELSSKTWVEKYTAIRSFLLAKASGEESTEEEFSQIDNLFKKSAELLRRAAYSDVEYHETHKHKAIRRGIKDGVLILSSGAIESYFPAGAIGSTKPEKALAAASLLNAQENFDWLPKLEDQDAGQRHCELSLFFSQLFSES